MFWLGICGVITFVCLVVILILNGNENGPILNVGANWIRVNDDGRRGSTESFGVE